MAAATAGSRPSATPEPDGTIIPAWTVDGTGHRCVLCDIELFMELGITATDADRKVSVAKRLLGLPGLPLVAVGNPLAFSGLTLWWCEHPGAEPAWSRDERFAHVDVDALRAEWHAVLHPPQPPDPRPRRKGTKCPTCGTRTKIAEVQSFPFGAGTIEREELICIECSRRWLAASGADVSTLA